MPFLFKYMTHQSKGWVIIVCQETLTDAVLPVHHVMLVSLEVLGQPHVLGGPLHPGDDEAEGEGLSAQGAAALRRQDAVNEAQTEGEAVVVLLLEPGDSHTGLRQVSENG